MRISPLLILFGIAVIVAMIAAGVVLLRQTRAPGTMSVRTADIQPGPLRHATLSAELDERIRHFEPIFAEVYPRSHEEWLDGFKRDQNPESEVAIWEAIAAAFQKFTEKHTLTKEARQEAFALLLVRSGSDEQTTLSGVKLRHLSPAEASELVKLYSARPQPVQVLKK
jgi:hypothetical protein